MGGEGRGEEGIRGEGRGGEKHQELKDFFFCPSLKIHALGEDMWLTIIFGFMVFTQHLGVLMMRDRTSVWPSYLIKHRGQQVSSHHDSVLK